MNHDRLLGMGWGVIVGFCLLAAYEVHPLMLAFAFLAIYFNYSYSVKR